MRAATSQPAFDLAVVGAGVARLATAIRASPLGMRVALIGPDARVFAPSETAPFDARIEALPPSAIELLQRLKVWPQMNAARVQSVAQMRVFGDAGNELTFDAYQAALERLTAIGEEGELTRVLSAACGVAPGVARVRAAFARMQGAGDAVRVELAGCIAVDGDVLLSIEPMSRSWRILSLAYDMQPLPSKERTLRNEVSNEFEAADTAGRRCSRSTVPTCSRRRSAMISCTRRPIGAKRRSTARSRRPIEL